MTHPYFRENNANLIVSLSPVKPSATPMNRFIRLVSGLIGEPSEMIDSIISPSHQMHLHSTVAYEITTPIYRCGGSVGIAKSKERTDFPFNTLLKN